MSGFVALAHFDGRPIDPALLERLTAALAFRGPDGRASHHENAAALGFAKLATTAEAAREDQPLSLDGRTWIVADARIDDRPGLIAALRQAGADVGTEAGDAELLLHGYRRWGEGLPERLLGDFSFVVWDGDRRRLFCVRDPLGVKPLYYVEWPGGVVVGNTLACLRRHPEVGGELEPRAIGDFLLFGLNRDPETTAFAGVRRVPPAHARLWSAAGARARRYWELSREPSPAAARRTADDWIDGLRHLLGEAVRDRLRTDRVAILMSGGLDSTAVAATVRDLRDAGAPALDARCFTLTYERLFRDPEGHFARVAANGLGLPHEIRPVDDYRLFERWDSLPPPPEPGETALWAMHHDFDRLLAGHGRVVLTGHGGDPIFPAEVGYLADQLRRLRPDRALVYLIDSWRRTGRRPPFGVMTAWQSWRRRRDPRAGYPSWLDPEFERRLDLPERWLQVWRGRNRDPHPLNPDLHQVLIAPDWPYFFEGWDPGARRQPLEYRHPFFDLRLVEHALHMPPTPWRVDKYVLRRAMRGRVPETIRKRPKTILQGNPVHPPCRPPIEEWRARSRATPEVAAFVEPGRVAAALREDQRSGRVGLYHSWTRRPLDLVYWLSRGISGSPADAHDTDRPNEV